MTVKMDKNELIFDVVCNHEDQYSIWAAGKDLPLGWHKDGKTGSREECLAYINETWTDMRPRSLREQMDVDKSA